MNDNPNDASNKISYSDAEDMFDDMLNSSYEAVQIMGLDYEPSEALKRIDPIAYRESLLNYMDVIESEIE